MKPEHQKIHLQFKQFGANAKLWIRKCILLLPEIEKHQVWKQKGFASIYEYASKLAGMSRNTVDDALRILHKIEDKPELLKIVEEKGLNAVRPVITIATTASEGFWAEKAAVMSKHTLEIYIKEFRKTFFGESAAAGSENLCREAAGLHRPAGFAMTDINLTDTSNSDGTFFRTGTGNNGENPHQQAISIFANEKSLLPVALPQSQNQGSYKKVIAMELEPEVLQELEKLKGQGDWNELMKQLLHMRNKQLEQQKPEAVKTESRHIPNKIQRFVFARTNGACSFPGCTKPMKIKHHTQRFGLEKIHDSDRLHGLCTEHERIAHLGLIENEEGAPQSWKIKKEPDRSAPKFEIDAMVAKYRMG